MKKLLLVFGLLLLLFPAAVSTAQNNPNRPLDLPVALEPGPSTWLLGQVYGNTTGAFNFGDEWYSAGQGLHFGIDLPMACGTPLVAMADAEVMFVDNLSFGSAPYNLILRFPEAGITALYGHLLDRPPVNPGQFVSRGELVGYSGDPDSTCVSRPHLHLEIRSLDYNTAYNPADYINTNWHNLMLIGSFSSGQFQRDLLNPRQWISVDDQPPVVFGGRRLNDYQLPYPSRNALQPPNNAPLPSNIDPLPANSTWNLRVLGFEGCCANAWWHPTDSDRLYVIDGSPGQIAAILEWSVSTGTPTNVISEAPPPYLSPDGAYQLIRNSSSVTVRRLADGAEWLAPTGGVLPAINPDNTQMLWLTRAGESVPGQAPVPVTIWVADINGENGRFIISQAGGGAAWLDGSRLLVSRPVPNERATTLSVYDTRDNSQYELGTWNGPRSLSIAPGGGRIMFYQTQSDNPAADGIYVIETQQGAQPQQISWFGAWRWRDADSVYYIPLELAAPSQTLRYYNVVTGEDRQLTDPTTMPFTIANGDWSVSPDGQHIVFQHAGDRTMWLLEEVS